MTRQSTSGGGGATGGGGSVGSGSAYAAMMATSYGTAAATDAQNAGISADALAAIGEVESGFENVPTANGSSSATGPWQILQGTFNQFNSQYGLGYSPSDITNPTARAQVASYIVKAYASAVSQATGQAATVLQTYGAYVFGPGAGSRIATADPSEPLSSYVSVTALTNNNMTGWTVRQFDAAMGAKLGSAASETVTTAV
jgi:Transglycosylase SLT domain